MNKSMNPDNSTYNFSSVSLAQSASAIAQARPNGILPIQVVLEAVHEKFPLEKVMSLNSIEYAELRNSGDPNFFEKKTKYLINAEFKNAKCSFTAIHVNSCKSVKKGNGLSCGLCKIDVVELALYLSKIPDRITPPFNRVCLN